MDVYAEKGSGTDTVAGIGLHSLAPGQLLDASTPFFTRDGDVNQEDLTNDAVGAWTAMLCWHFSLTDNPGVDHFSLPSDPGVLARLIGDAQAPRSPCRYPRHNSGVSTTIEAPADVELDQPASKDEVERAKPWMVIVRNDRLA